LLPAIALLVETVVGRAALPQAIQPPAESCTEAKSAIRVEVSSKIVARDVVAMTYRLTNGGTEPLTWIRIGSGRGVTMAVPPEETPAITHSPAGWKARVDRDAATNRVSLVWETTPEAPLRSGEVVELGVRARDRRYIRMGQTDEMGSPLMPIDSGALPFSAGSASRCWWGRTQSTWQLREGGYWSTTVGTTVRPFGQNGSQYLLVDVPVHDSTIRLTKAIALATTAGVSWGTAGGFSVDTAIGIGVSWTPSKYVSASAKARFGTFFFNNRTHLRTVGIDFHIPICRPPFTEVRFNQTKFLVVGVEYFDRDVVKWAGFLDGPAWYASGRGIGLRVGLREIGWSW
jgi:hypothetical protein